MKKISYILVFVLMCSAVFASQKKVLVEVFTNSHCPLCPPAHSALKAYIQSGSNKDNLTYIFYHMVFPYPDDPLNQANPDDPAFRNSYYGPFSSTPHGVFDGQIQSGNYSGWGSIIDGKATQDSPFDLTLKGSGVSGGDLSLTATVKQTAAVSSNDLNIYFVAVENINYQGRNGVSDNINVMRKIFPSSSGKSFSISLNQSMDIIENISINNNWSRGELGFVVFIQDNQSKTVYQSEYRTYNSLITTDVEETDNALPSSFTLFQNYPNPFNPNTQISYQISKDSKVQLIVYNILGREVATLVNEFKPAGKHSVEFRSQNAELPSGVYFYTLTAGSFVETKKMILLK